jgi:hypothetical protein
MESGATVLSIQRCSAFAMFGESRRIHTDQSSFAVQQRLFCLVYQLVVPVARQQHHVPTTQARAANKTAT